MKSFLKKMQDCCLLHQTMQKMLDCPICMETIEDVKNCTTTECNHCFHANCLMQNIRHNGYTCPYCRTTMINVPEDEETEDEETEDEETEDEETEDEETEDDDNISYYSEYIDAYEALVKHFMWKYNDKIWSEHRETGIKNYDVMDVICCEYRDEYTSHDSTSQSKTTTCMRSFAEDAIE